MNLKTILGPTVLPVTLVEAKNQIRVSDNSEDTYITSLIQAATVQVEKILNRALLRQTLELSLDEAPAFPLKLPRPPLIELVSVVLYGDDGTEKSVSASSFWVDTHAEPGRITLKQGVVLPGMKLRKIDSVRIQYKAGEMSAASVPANIKQAVLLLIGHWYANRESVVVGTVTHEVNFTLMALVGSDRIIPV